MNQNNNQNPKLDSDSKPINSSASQSIGVSKEKEFLATSQIEPAEFEEWEATLKAARRMKKRKPKRPVRPKEEY